MDGQDKITDSLKATTYSCKIGAHSLHKQIQGQWCYIKIVFVQKANEDYDSKIVYCWNESYHSFTRAQKNEIKVW